MIPASEVCPVVVTRGDVALDEIVGMLTFHFPAVLIYDNSAQADLAVYGRYAAIEQTDAPVILVQDDDVLLPPDTILGLLDACEPGKIVANMPQEYRERYTDSCLVGFGAIFDRDLPERAFARAVIPEQPGDTGGPTRLRTLVSPSFDRTCDIVFTTLTPRVLVDLPFTMLPHTRAPNRMYRQAGNGEERQRMLTLAREVRDSA